MYVNVAVLKETQPHERRVALVPSVVPKLIKLGAKLHMQTGAGDAIKLADAAFKDVAFIADRKALVADADVVLAVQPPALEVIDAMKEGAILDLLHLRRATSRRWCSACSNKKITCFAMETGAAHHAGAVDGRAVEPVGAGGLLRGAARRDPSGAASCRRSPRPPARSGRPRCW